MISILTLSAMLLHALLGCCAHHAHAAADGRASVAEHATTKSHSHGSACCHGHFVPSPADHEGEPDEQPQQHDCEEDTCTYVGSSKVELPPVDDSVWADLAFLDSAQISGLSHSFLARGEVPVDRGRTLTLRLHALHQVWLV